VHLVGGAGGTRMNFFKFLFGTRPKKNEAQPGDEVDETDPELTRHFQKEREQRLSTLSLQQLSKEREQEELAHFHRELTRRNSLRQLQNEREKKAEELYPEELCQQKDLQEAFASHTRAIPDLNYFIDSDESTRLMDRYVRTTMTAILRHLQKDRDRRRISMADLDIYINFFPDIFSTQYRLRTEFILNANGLSLKMDPRLKFDPGDLVKMFNPYYIAGYSGLAITPFEELSGKKKRRGKGSPASSSGSAADSRRPSLDQQEEDPASRTATASATPSPARRASPAGSRRRTPAGSNGGSPARSVQSTPPRSRQSSSSQLVVP